MNALFLPLPIFLLLLYACSSSGTKKNEAAANIPDTVTVVDPSKYGTLDFRMLLEQRNYFKAPEAKICTYGENEILRYYHYNSKVYVERLSENGLMKWKKQLFFGVNNVVNEVIEGPDKKVIGLSRAFDDEHQIHATLFCLDSLGKLLWKKDVGSLKADFMVRNEDRLAIVGYTGDLEEYHLLTTNLEGEKIRDYKIKNLKHFSQSRLLLDRDGNYLLAGGISQPDESTQSEVLLLTVNKKGKIIHRYEDGSPQNDWISDASYLEDGNLLCIAAWEADMSRNQHQKRLMCFDSELDVVWQRSYQFNKFWADNSCLFSDNKQALYSVSSGPAPASGRALHLVEYGDYGEIREIAYLGAGSRAFAPYSVCMLNDNRICISTNAGVIEFRP